MKTSSEITYLIHKPQRTSWWCTKWPWISIIIVVAVVYVLSTYKFLQQQSNKEWVFLMFTQQWPPTFCISWKEEGHENCHFAKNPLEWTVHGIWPTRDSNSYPQFCRNIPFNDEVLYPLKDQLEEHWTSASSNGELNFLKHEWNKHGTCAVELSTLNTELKYFSLGLEWNKKYNITNALYSCNIEPNDDLLYSKSTIYDCLTKYYGASPQLSCLEDKDKNVEAIDEVRLCFDKDLSLRNCTDYDLPELCKGTILYPKTV